jgi:peptidoglycan/xylan/chitin deacetylase (PgdA/CDA1 family)
MFDLVNNETIEYVTFNDFGQVSPRSGFALAFDDDAIEKWYEMRGILRAHHARVTFFVAAYHVWTEEQRAMLAELAADGHSVQAHGVNHLFADHYLVDHTVSDYVEQEVLPSIAALKQAGYPVTTFAFPGGASTDELTAAVLDYVPRVRVGGSSCPY